MIMSAEKLKMVREKGLLGAASVACLVVAVQMVMILIKGKPVCLNEGCKVVDGLAKVSPLLFNALGFGYFLAVLLLLLGRRRPVTAVDWSGMLLTTGLAVEGALFAYQAFAVQAFCAYCLTILGFVVLMNLLAGWVRIVQGVAVFAGIVLIFSLVSFGSSLLLARQQDLSSGTYAVKTCATPVKSMYLIFSSACPHCQEVIKVLDSCDSCDFHFNPIDTLKESVLPGLSRTAVYHPEINRLILAMLGINEVPVLLVRNTDGFSFIKGEGNIISYIKATCMPVPVDPAQPLGISSLEPGGFQGRLPISGQPDGGCLIQNDCN